MAAPALDGTRLVPTADRSSRAHQIRVSCGRRQCCPVVSRWLALGMPLVPARCALGVPLVSRGHPRGVTRASRRMFRLRTVDAIGVSLESSVTRWPPDGVSMYIYPTIENREWQEAPVADSPEHMQIEYGVYVPSDAEAMVQLLGEVFSRHDPPAVAVALTSAEFEEFVRLLCPRAATERLTIVARLAGTGGLVGALLAEDSASALPDGIDRLSAKFDPIFDILGQLDTEYRQGRAVRAGESLHLFLLGVSDRVAGKGVAQHLVTACLENGVRRGYRVAVTEATNEVSQHIFRKQGFVTRVQRSYEAHRFNGRQYFASIAEHEGPMLMDKSLAP